MQRRPVESHLRLIAAILSLWSLLAYLASEARIVFEAPLVLLVAGIGVLSLPSVRKRVPERVWTGGLLALFLALLFQVYRTPAQVVVYLFAFVRWLLVAKLWTRCGTRDELQVLLLAFFILLGASVFTYGYELALFVSGFVVLAPAALYLAAVSGSTVSAQALPRGFYPRSLAVGAVVAVGGALAFALLPRVSSSLVTFDFLGGGDAPAYPLEMRLDERGPLRASGRVIFRVHAEPFDAPARLWRVQSLDVFDGRRWWRRPSVERSLARAARGVFVDDTEEWRKNGADVLYRFELSPLLLPSLITPQPPGEDGDGLAVRGPLARVARASDGTLSFDRAGGPPGRILPLEYEIAFQERAPRVPRLRQSEWEHFTALPEALDPRIGELAAKLSQAGESGRERAEGVERYLTENFFYSLEREPAAAADPLAAFLFDERSGHCEYFASAAAVLLRAMGVPARVATGFAGGVRDDDGAWVVREQDAHSWVEAFDPASGWIAVDPSPRDLDAEHARLGDWRLWWSAARERADWYWYEFVLQYSLNEQIALVERMVEGSLRVSGASEAPPPAGTGSPLAALADALKVALGIAMVAGLGWFAFGKRSRNERLRRKEDALAGVLRPLRREARRRGIEAGDATTPLEIFRALAPGLRPQARAALAQWVGFYNLARFGAGGGRCERRQNLRRAWKKVRRLLRERTPAGGD